MPWLKKAQNSGVYPLTGLLIPSFQEVVTGLTEVTVQRVGAWSFLSVTQVASPQNGSAVVIPVGSIPVQFRPDVDVPFTLAHVGTGRVSRGILGYRGNLSFFDLVEGARMSTSVTYPTPGAMP